MQSSAMKKWFYYPVICLLTLLATAEAKAQNFNTWTADPPAPITPRRKRPASKPKPTPVVRDTVAIEVPKVEQSRLIKRGLTQRMKAHKPLEEDNTSVEFFANNSRYPTAAAMAGAQGNVLIRLQIAPDGHVSRTSVVAVEPRPIPGYNTNMPPAAMDALANEAQRVFRMLKFEPASSTSEEELSASFSLQ
ncbi:hypothetical protein F1C16_07650 [Hymenobacter sp. NBH84]|nr:hypothetical protein F1C16_07650 [Hymenobacter sp. NBH84]